MKISGIGSDLVKIARIEKLAHKYGDRFASHILTKLEIASFKSNIHPVHFLAKRFAAKEALVKALGTGFRDGIFFNQIEIKNDKNGKPYFECYGMVKAEMDRKNITEIHLSLSDEKEYCLAFVILL